MQMVNKGSLTMVGMAVVLAGCGSTGGKLLGKSLPDETQVIDGPNLALPPQFELRPPRESTDYESVLRAQKGAEARSLITTGTSATDIAGEAPASGEVPASDAWLLDKTNARAGVVADPNVRNALANPSAEDVKATEDAKAKKGLIGRWFGKDEDSE